MSGESSHVHLVNDGPGGRPLQPCVAFPIIGVWIHYHALHRCGGVVAFQARSIAAVIVGNNYAAPVWVKEDLGGVKPHPTFGIERSLDPISIKLPRLHARQEYMPVMVGTVGRWVDRNDAR